MTISLIELVWEQLLNQGSEDLRKERIATAQFAEVHAKHPLRLVLIGFCSFVAQICCGDWLVVILILNLREDDGNTSSFTDARLPKSTNFGLATIQVWSLKLNIDPAIYLVNVVAFVERAFAKLLEDGCDYWLGWVLCEEKVGAHRVLFELWQ